MMGYGRSDQQAQGLHTRLRSRAFVIVDRATSQRVLLVVVDSPMIFESVRQEVLRRLASRFDDLYAPGNVMITGTHTHAGPGGYSHHLLYNMTTYGYHDRTFQAVTDGIVESVARAHADLAPARITLSHGELRNASVNRSRPAFDRNPASDRAHFPDAIDPQTSLLRIEHDGRTVGVVNWFATHNTSMSGDNRLISSDNKGYAALHWEREIHGVDYLAHTDADFVAAFAQTNAGDMSPNLDLRPPTTPEDFDRTRVIGLRQYRAASGLLSAPGLTLTGGVDSRLVYVDMSATTVRAPFTGDGREHRTCEPAIGASMAAGSMEDGPAFPTFQEGENPLWDAISDAVIYPGSPETADCQAPKDVFVPVGGLNRLYPWVQERLPVQLVRIGALYLIGIPGEVTITAGLRLRRTVAEAVGADLRNVLVAGYANAYAHYVTTPQEYDAQHYEGGSTLFGRWELPAFQQTAYRLAVAMRDGRSLPLGPVPPDLSDQQFSLRPGVLLDLPPLRHDFGDVLTQPRDSYRPGERVAVSFAGAHPNNDLHLGGSYLEVQRFDGTSWRGVYDDGDWSTRLHWRHEGIAASRVTVTWDIPPDTAGSYRIRYHGDARRLFGGLSRFTGTSATFTVRA
jgi:neutral ceramidase